LCIELYNKIAKWDNITPSNIIITPGSDGAIRMVFQAFVNEGDTVVFPDPTFAMYSVYSKMFGAISKTIAYKRTEVGPELTVIDIISHLQIAKPKLFCLPNPDSPTGTLLTKDEIIEILKFCNKYEIVVLIDEAYYPFCNTTCSDLINKYDNLLIARTFAKAWGSAGIRLGYLISNENLMFYIHKLRPMYEANTIGIDFMNKMFDHIDKMNSSVNRILEGKIYFTNELEKLGYKVLKNTHGNFLHVNFGDDADIIHKKLENLVLYRKNFNEYCLSGYSRFSLTTVENIKLIINKIKE
jgi:histidinol-phosphate aminotransferase